MKLLKVLEQLNSIEKNSFIKIIETIIDELEKEDLEKYNNIYTILNSSNDSLIKNLDNKQLSQIFQLCKNNYKNKLNEMFGYINSQFDIIVDIITRDGNNIMSRIWFDNLYSNEINNLEIKIKNFTEEFTSETIIETPRTRDYRVYFECIKKAFHNDEENNLDPKITSDEQEILIQLSKSLGLSQVEMKLINYSVISLNRIEIDSLIKELKDCGSIAS